MEANQKVFSTPWFYVEALLPNPSTSSNSHPFYRIVESDGVFAMILTDTDEFVMVRQYRPALDCFTLEFPAGAVDQGETPVDACMREVYEETGFQCSMMALMGGGVLKPNRNHCWEWYCLGIGAKRPADWRTSEEKIETVLLSRAALREMIVDGTFIQLAALSLCAVISIRYNINIFEDSLESISVKMKLINAVNHTYIPSPRS